MNDKRGRGRLQMLRSDDIKRLNGFQQMKTGKNSNKKYNYLESFLQYWTSCGLRKINSLLLMYNQPKTRQEAF